MSWKSKVVELKESKVFEFGEQSGLVERAAGSSVKRPVSDRSRDYSGNEDNYTNAPIVYKFSCWFSKQNTCSQVKPSARMVIRLITGVISSQQIYLITNILILEP